MKVGPRKPNIKKRIKAKTTGKVKRSVKKAVNPLYGKKGMGLVKDPRKSTYNYIYNRTTFDATKISNNTKHGKNSYDVFRSYDEEEDTVYQNNSKSISEIIMAIVIALIIGAPFVAIGALIINLFFSAGSLLIMAGLAITIYKIYSSLKD